MSELARRAYSVQELASIWGFSARHIYNLIDKGELGAFKLGKSRGYRIPVDEVTRWEKAVKSQPTEPEIAISDGKEDRPLPSSVMSRLARGAV